MEIEAKCFHCLNNDYHYLLKCCKSKICSDCRQTLITESNHICPKCGIRINDRLFEAIKRYDKCKNHSEEDLLGVFCLYHCDFLCEKCMKKDHSECQVKQFTQGTRKILSENLKKFYETVRNKLIGIEKKIEKESSLELLKIAKDPINHMNLLELTNSSFFKMFENELFKYSLILSFDEVYDFLTYFERNRARIGFLYKFTNDLIFICNSLDDKKLFFEYMNMFLIVGMDITKSKPIIFFFGIQNIAFFDFNPEKEIRFIKLKKFNCNNFDIDLLNNQPINYSQFFDNFNENPVFRYILENSVETLVSEITEYEIYISKSENLLSFPISNELIKDLDHRIIYLNGFISQHKALLNIDYFKYITNKDYDELNLNNVCSKYFLMKNFFLIVSYRSTILGLFNYIHNPKSNKKHQTILMAEPYFSYDSTKDPLITRLNQKLLIFANSSLEIVLDFNKFVICIRIINPENPFSNYIYNNDKNDIFFLKVFSLYYDV